MTSNNYFLKSCDENELKFYKSVILLSAGGTINMSGTSECKPSDGVARALNSIKRKLNNIGISIISENLFDRPPDSTNVGEVEWMVILRRINEIIYEKECIEKKLINEGIKIEKGGIVVAHGTDTLHITSLVISLELSLKKLPFPIVFTASHSTFEREGSDAKNNLQKSVYVAKERFNSDSGLLPGVYVLIGQDIHLASRLTKVYTQPNSDGKYFFSFPSPIGQITGAKKKDFHFKTDNQYLKELVKSHYQNEYSIKILKDWGIVEIIYVDKFAKPNVIDDLYRRINYYRSVEHLRGREIGVVIQGDFKNNSELSTIVNTLKKLDKEKIIVFIGSKQTFMKIKEMEQFLYLGLIPKSLSHLKAKIKLGWLLRSNLPKDKIMQVMNINVVGEIFETDALPEWINFETFHNYNDNTEIVLAYPNIDAKVLDDAVKRLSQSSSNRKELYLYGFGDGHYPTTNMSITDITMKYLNKILRKEDLRVNSDSIEGIIEDICTIIQEQKNNIVNYFDNKFDLDTEKMGKVLKQYVIKSMIWQEKHNIKERIEAIYFSFQSHNAIRTNIKDMDGIVKCVYDKIKFEVDDKQVSREIEKLSNKYSYVNDRRKSIELLVDNFPRVIALRILKDAVMLSNQNMKIIGRAIDTNINVVVKTLAVKSLTDISKYEAGNMLMIIGVDSDKQKGFENKVFIPRNQ